MITLWSMEKKRVHYFDQAYDHLNSPFHPELFCVCEQELRPSSYVKVSLRIRLRKFFESIAKTLYFSKNIIDFYYITVYGEKEGTSL